MTNEWGKTKRPAPTASTAGTCLSVVSIGNAPMPKVPQHLNLISCFQEGMLVFDGPLGHCFSRFPTVSPILGGKEERERIDRKSKSK